MEDRRLLGGVVPHAVDRRGPPDDENLAARRNDGLPAAEDVRFRRIRQHQVRLGARPERRIPNVVDDLAASLALRGALNRNLTLKNYIVLLRRGKLNWRMRRNLKPP